MDAVSAGQPLSAPWIAFAGVKAGYFEAAILIAAPERIASLTRECPPARCDLRRSSYSMPDQMDLLPHLASLAQAGLPN